VEAVWEKEVKLRSYRCTSGESEEEEVTGEGGESEMEEVVPE